MLADIMASFLKINDVEARKIFDAVRLRQGFQRELRWGNQKYNFSAIKTQRDLISFMHAAGQAQWLGNIDTLINLNYSLGNLKKYEIALSPQELEEVKTLCQEKNKLTINVDNECDKGARLGPTCSHDSLFSKNKKPNKSTFPTHFKTLVPIIDEELSPSPAPSHTSSLRK